MSVCRTLSRGILLLAMTGGLLAVGEAANYEPRVGQPHADFVLPTVENGKAVSLSQFRGKKVVLIHFASW